MGPVPFGSETAGKVRTSLSSMRRRSSAFAAALPAAASSDPKFLHIGPIADSDEQQESSTRPHLPQLHKLPSLPVPMANTSRLQTPFEDGNCCPHSRSKMQLNSGAHEGRKRSVCGSQMSWSMPFRMPKNLARLGATAG